MTDYLSLAARVEGADFWSKVDRRGPDDCWEWTSTRNTQGYGRYRHNLAATHVSLALDGRERPSKRHEACHKCDNPPCVNPSHLWWGTRRENMLDSIAKGRCVIARQKAQTHCQRGHEFTDENTYRDHRGRRQCRTCRSAGFAAWRVINRPRKAA